MNLTTKIILASIALALSFGLGYFATPTKIETKEVVKTVVQKEEAKTKIVYRDRVTKPDGTIIEKEVEKEESKSKEKSESEKIAETETTKDTGFTLSALVVVPINNIQSDKEYAITASKRVLGALNVTGMVTTERKIGIGLGWSF